MRQITINADGREISVQHDAAELDQLETAAFTLWEKTDSAPRMTAGFSSALAERATQWDHDRKPPVRAEH